MKPEASPRDPVGSTFQGDGVADTAVPPDQLFRFVADDYFENARKWDTGLLEITKTSEGPVGPGTTGRQARMDLPGLRAEQSLQVVAFERDRLFTVQAASADQGTLRATYAFEPKGTGTRLTVRLEMEWLGGSFLMRSAMKQNLRHATEVLARRIASLAGEPSASPPMG